MKKILIAGAGINAAIVAAEHRSSALKHPNVTTDEKCEGELGPITEYIITQPDLIDHYRSQSGQELRRERRKAKRKSGR